MSAISTVYPSTSYSSLASAIAAQSSSNGSQGNATATAEPAATSITLSDAALAALATKDFATVVAETKTKLDALLEQAERTSPLDGDDLALDLSSLDSRELYAMASDDSFSDDEHTAAGIEMQRRFEAALAGPAALADVTGNYANLYKAAAAYLDSLGPEEKDGADWNAARDALTEGIRQLQTDPKTLPDAGADDPVALYLALVEAGEAIKQTDIADVGATARKTLDALYAEAIDNGKAPTFNKQTTVGTYIDMSAFDSRSLSAIALNTGDQFSTEEMSAANTALRAKSGAALLAGFQSAAKSSDPTAFSQNIISLYSSMSSEEREAAGWTDQFYQAAVASYQITNKLTQMFADASGGSTSFLSWMK